MRGLDAPQRWIESVLAITQRLIVDRVPPNRKTIELAKLTVCWLICAKHSVSVEVRPSKSGRRESKGALEVSDEMTQVVIANGGVDLFYAETSCAKQETRGAEPLVLLPSPYRATHLLLEQSSQTGRRQSDHG
jgi:hypothetical protein